MSGLLKTLNQKSVKIAVLIFALVLIGFVTFDLTLKAQGGYLILFSVLYVFLPGFLLINAVDKSFIRRFRAQSLIIAFYIGFALLIGQYYLLNALGALHLIWLTPVVITFVLVFFSYKNLKNLPKPALNINLLDKSLPYIVLIAITAVAGYVVLVSSVPDQFCDVHFDYAYHMGNVNILTRAGNMEDTRVMGMTFKYHYFNDLYYAILRLIFPAQIWNCIFRYPILLIAPLVAPGIYSWIKSKTKKPLLSFIVTIFIVFFPSIYPWTTKFTTNILNNFNNVGFALPAAIAMVHILSNSSDEKEFKYTDLLIVFMLGVVLTGTKGPFALILAASMFAFVIYCSIARRKIQLNQVLLLVSVMAAFALIWFTLLNVAINEENIYTDKPGILKYFEYNIQMPEDVVFADRSTDPKYALLTIPISLVSCFAGAAIPFVIMIPYFIVSLFRKNREKIDLPAVFAAICACVSIGGSYFLSLDRNRVYFLMFSIPFVYLTAVSFFELVRNNKKKGIVITSAVILGTSVILCGASMVCSILNPERTAGFETLTQSEIDGINWIKENTDKDALFAINDPCPDWKFYYYSGFSERRFYIESYVYAKNSGKTAEDLKAQTDKNEELFTNSDTRAIAQELGVDYLVYFDRSGAAPELLEDNYRLLFSNECLRIYSVT